MEKDQASQLIAMYGGRFPDYALHSMHTQLQNMDYSEASIRLAQSKDPTIFFSYPSSSDNSASTASS